MEDMNLLKSLKNCGEILYEKKWWITGVTILAAVLSFVFTLPSINKPLKEVNSTFLVVNFPKNIGIQQHQFASIFFTSGEFKSEILRIYGSKVDPNTELDITNFNERISITSSKTNVSFVVRHESGEIAVQIINTAINLFNEKINEVVSTFSETELSEIESAIKLKQQQVDSIKNEITKFSIENNILISTNTNQGLIESFISSSNRKLSEKMFKIAQEQSATLLVLEKDLEQKIIHINQLIKERDDVYSKINTQKDYVVFLSKPNIEMAKDYPNRLRIILISIVLAIFVSCGFFLLYNNFRF